MRQHLPLEYNDWRFDGCRTLYECFISSVRKAPDNPLLGSRSVDAKGNASHYVWQSYGQVYQRVNRVANALIHIGCKRGDRIGLYSVNRPAMMIHFILL